MHKPNGTPYRRPMAQLDTARIVAQEREKREREIEDAKARAWMDAVLGVEMCELVHRDEIECRERDA